MIKIEDLKVGMKVKLKDLSDLPLNENQEMPDGFFIDPKMHKFLGKNVVISSINGLVLNDNYFTVKSNEKMWYFSSEMVERIITEEEFREGDIVVESGEKRKILGIKKLQNGKTVYILSDSEDLENFAFAFTEDFFLKAFKKFIPRNKSYSFKLSEQEKEKLQQQADDQKISPAELIKNFINE